jgi:hypothetical protein
MTEAASERTMKDITRETSFQRPECLRDAGCSSPTISCRTQTIVRRSSERGAPLRYVAGPQADPPSRCLTARRRRPPRNCLRRSAGMEQFRRR